MAVSIRPATLDDVPLLLTAIDMASDGVVPALWSEMAPEGMTGKAVGDALVRAEEGQFSYKCAIVAEAAGQGAGALLGYVAAEESGPEEMPVPPVFAPVVALEATVRGWWYVNVVAVLPEAQGRGIGAALMAEAEASARSAGAPGVALIVAASNTGAMAFYHRLGFTEAARSPLDPGAYGGAPTEAVLLTRAL